MLRVISGKHKGLRLNAPEGEDTRPSKDALKEALFSSLGNISDLSFLDLFAGSGAVGIEALSRGACPVVFNDHSPKAVKVIKENLTKAREEAEVTDLSAEAFLAKTEASFDLIFLDPPYAYIHKQKLLELIHKKGILKAEGTLIYEESSASPVEETVGPFVLVKQKKYGVSRLCYYKENRS
ncbi:MAG: 16S rRNA (guanine(966)-N(2))-methyltransferase RsmD [Erysipelotrichaceae bacterium]|nr:16S rRNA (guanine(966)-N(2))-methyltransferase RsmD [Erysipelotrichaceae bacterium]